jgi:hypothetical protein
LPGVHEARRFYRRCASQSANRGSPGRSSGALLGLLDRFAGLRLDGEPRAVYQRIATSCEALMKQAAPDPGRPSIEFYRRRDVIDLLLPVR